MLLTVIIEKNNLCQMLQMIPIPIANIPITKLQIWKTIYLVKKYQLANKK